MPGLIFSRQRLELPSKGLLPHMAYSTLLNVPFLHVACSSYEGYPLRKLTLDKKELFIEGFIYDLSIEDVDQQLANIIHSELEIGVALSEWIAQRDGEFILSIIDLQTEEIIIANDVFGRLPLYVYAEGEKIVISREIALLLDEVKPTYEQYSLATYLLLGYAIGNKTIWNGITKLPGHSILFIDSSSESPRQVTYSHPERFFQNRGPVATSTELIKHLETALERRLKVMPKSALAMSGGLDSRIIAGLLKKTEKNLLLLTYTRNPEANDSDVNSAREVVNRLGFTARHAVIDLSVVSPSKVDDLFQIKRGQNFLGMAYILPFLETFRDQHLAQFTGDGGDKTLESLLPLKNLRTGKQLLEYIIKQNAVLPPEKVTQITGLSAEEIKAYILPQLRNNNLSYNDCYACFILKERGFNWLFEGEDRNRYYSWSTTPYYAPIFFEAALSIPGKDKLHGKLFVQLLKQLPGHTEEVVNPNWNLAPCDTSAVQRLFLRQQLKALLPAILLRLKGGRSPQTYQDFQRTWSFLPKDMTIPNPPKWLGIKKVSEAVTIPVGGYWYLISAFFSRKS